MPDFDVTLNLPGFTIARTSGFNPIIHDLDCHHAPSCPRCGGADLRKKDNVRRHVWHESVGLRRVLLRFSVCKYHCRGCGRYGKPIDVIGMLCQRLISIRRSQEAYPTGPVSSCVPNDLEEAS